MQASGMQPIGLNQQNLLDQARNEQFMKMHEEMMTNAAELDRENTLRTVQGIFRMPGAQFTDEQRRATETMVNNLLPVAGKMLAPTEGGAAALELLGGRRGSNLVMSHRVLMGSRYRYDAGTGQLGQSPEAIKEVLASMSGMVNQNNVADLKGFTAGKLGDMHQFLLSRGLLSSGSGPAGTRAGLAAMDNTAEGPLGRAMERMGLNAGTAMSKLTDAQVTSLSRDTDVEKAMGDDPAVAGAMRKFDARKVSGRVKEYLGAARAIGDLFGRPDAAIPELMAALEKFMGPSAMAQMSPHKIAQMVRQTHELSRAAGLTPAAISGLRGHISNQAAAMGVEQPFVQGILQDTIAFGTAHRGVGYTAAWGRMSDQQATQAFAQRRTNAVRSRAANRVSAFLRMRAASGGKFESEAAETMAQQIMSGTLTDIPTVRELSKLTGDGALFNRYLGQTGTNREFGMEPGVQASIMGLQGVDFKRITGMVGGAEVARQLGLDPTMRKQFGEGVVTALMGLDEASMAKQDVRNKTIQTAVRAQLDALVASGDMTQEQADAKSAQMTLAGAGAVWGELDKGAESGGMRNFQWGYQQYNPVAAEKARRNTLVAGVNAQIADDLGGLGRGSFAQRLVTAIQESPSGEIDDILQRTAGVKQGEIYDAVRGSLQAVGEERAGLDDLQKQLLKAKTPDQKRDIMRKIEIRRKALQEAVQGVAKLGVLDKLGSDADKKADAKGTKEALDKIKDQVLPGSTTTDVEKGKTGSGSGDPADNAASKTDPRIDEVSLKEGTTLILKGALTINEDNTVDVNAEAQASNSATDAPNVA
jgi:hypothetical protein